LPKGTPRFLQGHNNQFHGDTVVMTRRYFWQVPEFIKFRMVFENTDTILGANDAGEHKLFRKDTGKICFDEAAALRQRLSDLAEAEQEAAEALPPSPTTRASFLSHIAIKQKGGCRIAFLHS
jgi:hypothetical protein